MKITRAQWREGPQISDSLLSAIKLGMRHPDRFGVVYGLNPSLLGWGGDVASLGEIKSLDDLGGAHFYVQAIVTISQCFSPNAKSPLLPYFSDLLGQRQAE